MANKVKAYFFDWMGTLADAEERKTVRDILSREEHHSLLLNKFDDVNLKEERRNVIYDKLMKSRHWIYSDSIEIISGLSGKYPLAVVSNMYSITAQRIKHLFPGFLDRFEWLTLSAEVGLKKPDPKIFIYTLNNLNRVCGTDINFSQVVMIGDDEEKDVKPPLALGMQAKLIDRTKQKLRDIIK